MHGDTSGLGRFLTAQADGEFDSALAEIEAGRKRSHWIWFVFPQIQGLGTSQMSQTYAIAGRDEAVAYLQHPVLSARLMNIAEAAAAQTAKGVPLTMLMGSAVDAAKLVSSMTLFAAVTRGMPEHQQTAVTAAIANAADVILTAAASQGFARCGHTEAVLAS
jgi:uncharacterized protein (DUF1810 family)